MTTYEIKKNKKFDLFEKEDVKIDGKLINLCSYPEISFILVSTDSYIYKIYSNQDFSSKKKPKYVIKPEINEIFIKRRNSLSGIIFEINPDSEEKLTMAVGYSNKIMIIVFSKKKQSKFISEYKEKCKFIQWENGLLICAFENKIIKIVKNNNILKAFKDEDYITSMKAIHFQDFKLLVTGYNRKVIIRNYYSILNIDNESQFYRIPLEGKIDIIEYSNQYILFCSKKNSYIYCYRFMNNNWKPIPTFEITRFKNMEDIQEIVNVKLYLNKGLFVAFRNSIYIFYITNKKEELQYILQYNYICFFTLMHNREYNSTYLVIGLIDKIIKQKIELFKIASYKNTFENNRELIKTIVNTLINRKNEFIIRKMDEFNLLEVQMDEIYFKIEFNIRDISLDITILKCEDYRLKEILEEELELINNSQYEIDDRLTEIVTEKLNKLYRKIKLFYSSENEYSYEDSEKNDLIKEINKLKIHKDKFLEYYKFLKIWQEIVKIKTPINNLYKEEDDFDVYNKTMISPLKDLVNWDFSFEKLNVDKAFDFINFNSNGYNYKDSDQSLVPFYSPLINKKDKKRKKSISTNRNSITKKEKEKLNDIYENNFENSKVDNFNLNIVNDDKKCSKLTKEAFKMHINKINKNIYFENFIVLLEILKQINYYLGEIISQKSNNLTKLYIMNLLDIFRLLESQENFELLFICILPLSSIIYNELNREIRKKDTNKISKSRISKDCAQENRINSSGNIINAETKNIMFMASSSDSNEDKDENSFSFVLNTEINNNFNNPIIDSYNENNFSGRKKYKKYSKNSEDLTRTFRNIPKLKSNISFLSITNKNDKNLIEILGSNFFNIIIDYVIFFSEELKMLSNDSAEKNTIDFFILVTKYYERKRIVNEIKEIIKKVII